MNLPQSHTAASGKGETMVNSGVSSVHLFRERLLSTCYVPDTGIGADGVAVSNTKKPRPYGAVILEGRDLSTVQRLSITIYLLSFTINKLCSERQIRAM